MPSENCETNKIIGERIYKRIQWEIADYYKMYKIKPNYIILGESEYMLLEAMNEKLSDLEVDKKRIFDILFKIEEDGMGFKIGYMREISL